ncbi:MAG: carboxypeptidase-like regulatory domain-containing protein [Candidatus Aminicenantes bacterium]|nr:carboxypeptidase-like regulatory domain-containing protein [Candidatus Aminicenantes bacterium]MDH5714691.1 carboxypeptidase-like regulatory domain-containing protein [Candidatus Aminicenantes bacterium]
MKRLPFVKPLVLFLVSFLAFAGFPFDFSTNVEAEVKKGSIVGVVFQSEDISAKDGAEVLTKWPSIANPFYAVEGAEVKAINTETGEIYFSSKTDKYGIYRIENLPAGEYKILISIEEEDITSDIVVKVEPNKQIPLPLMLIKTKTAGIFMVILVGSAAVLGYLIGKAICSPCEPG